MLERKTRKSSDIGLNLNSNIEDCHSKTSVTIVAVYLQYF